MSKVILESFMRVLTIVRRLVIPDTPVVCMQLKSFVTTTWQFQRVNKTKNTIRDLPKWLILSPSFSSITVRSIRDYKALSFHKIGLIDRYIIVITIIFWGLMAVNMQINYVFAIRCKILNLRAENKSFRANVRSWYLNGWHYLWKLQIRGRQLMVLTPHVLTLMNRQFRKSIPCRQKWITFWKSLWNNPLPRNHKAPIGYVCYRESRNLGTRRIPRNPSD